MMASATPTKLATERASANAGKKPAVIEVRLEKTKTPERHELARATDWAVIFEDVLEIRAKDGTHYYPLGAVRKWTVTPLEKEPTDG